MGNSNKYLELKQQIKEKVEAAGGTRYSQSDLTALTHALINTPEHEVSVYMKDSEEPITTTPVQHYRESLKPVLKEFGVDSAELDRIQQVTFNKDHANAINELATTIVKDYTETGRKLILPITGEDQSQMAIYQVNRDEKKEETKKPFQQEDGTYVQVPTGKEKTTKQHKEIRVENKIPHWLVSEVNISK